MGMISKIADATKTVANVFTTKNKMKEKISTNKKEIKVSENTSPDSVVRRWKIGLAYIILLVIVLEYFGVRVLILRKAGIDAQPVDYSKMITMFMNAFQSLILN